MSEIDFFTRAQAVRQVTQPRFNFWENLMCLKYPQLKELILVRDISSAAIYSYYLTFRHEDNVGYELIKWGLQPESLIYIEMNGKEGKITGEIRRLVGALYPNHINVPTPRNYPIPENVFEALFISSYGKTSFNHLNRMENGSGILRLLELPEYEEEDAYYPYSIQI